MCDPATALLGGGLVSGIGSIFGASQSASAARSAAQTQAQAANNAANLQYLAEQQALGFQQQQFNTLQGNIAPFLAGGGQYGADLSNQINALNTNVVGTFPHTVTDAYSATENPLAAANTFQLPSNLALLAQTPGYQFTLQQGLEATQNGFAAQGLGTSGAALKGAANYAENLASTTYQQQFQNYLNANQLQSTAANANQQNYLTAVQNANNQQLALQGQLLQQQGQHYQQLYQPYALAEGAAIGQGQVGAGIANAQAQTAQTGGQLIGQQITSGAAAQAAGTVGAANAITQGVQGIGGTASNTALLLALNQAGLFGTGSAAGSVNQDFSG